MKIDLSSLSANTGINALVIPLITLAQPVEEKLKLTGMCKFKLWSNPVDKDSLTYKVVVKQFRSGTPEEFIQMVIP
jgi:hypothetical protein